MRLQNIEYIVFTFKGLKGHFSIPNHNLSCKCKLFYKNNNLMSDSWKNDPYEPVLFMEAIKK